MLERDARLRALFTDHADEVLRYAARHLDAAGAQDIVSDTFLVAWRRLDDVPDPPLPWLLVVARHSISNRARGMTRQRRLAGEMAALERSAGSAVGAEDLVLERAGVVAALAALNEEQREALLLVAWDGLSVADAAGVAGCSRSAFAVRLHRARRRLADAMTDRPEPHIGRPPGLTSKEAHS